MKFNFLKQFRRKEKVKSLVPKSRQIKLKTAKWVIRLFFSVVFLFSFIAFGRVMTLREELNKVNSTLENVNYQLSLSTQNGTSFFDLRSKERYIEEFLRTYINTSLKSDEQKIRLEKLKRFYVSNLEIPKQDIKENYTRVQAMDRVDYSVKNGYETFVYHIRFKVSKLVTEEQEENGQIVQKDIEKFEEHTVFFGVDLMTKNNQYNILHLPYVIVNHDYYGSSVDNTIFSGQEMTDTTVKKDIEQFLSQFFIRYADNRLEDLKYMMSEPFGMGGNYTAKQLSKLKVYEKNNGYTVTVLVDFNRKGTDLIHTEYFEIDLVKKDNNFMIEALKR